MNTNAIEGEKDWTRIEIVYGTRPMASGWVPQITIDGREHWDWRLSGWAEDEALAMAKEWAAEEAGRYGGDWTIVVREGK